MRAHTRQPGLTPRQFEILVTLMEGASNRDIATRLGVSEQTVKNQLTVMYEKTGVQNRLQLALEGLSLVRRASDSGLYARRLHG
jgi:DNA-binding NarL/FixJ family response regulator